MGTFSSAEKLVFGDFGPTRAAEVEGEGEVLTTLTGHNKQFIMSCTSQIGVIHSFHRKTTCACF